MASGRITINTRNSQNYDNTRKVSPPRYRAIIVLMTREIVVDNQILVVTPDGHFHVADISDVVAPLINRDSIRPALEKYFEKHGLRMATAQEAKRHGFPTRESRLDRQAHVPKQKFVR